MGKPVNREAIAKRLGVSFRTTYNLEKRGMPTLGNSRFDPEACEAWYREYQERGQKPTNLVEAETRLKTAQAQIQELKLAQARRELVPTLLIGQVWERVVGAFRSRILSIPRKAIPRLRGVSGDAAKEKILNGMICEALDELAGADYSGILLGAVESVAPGNGVGEGAPATDGEPVGGPAPRPVARGKRRARKVEHNKG